MQAIAPPKDFDCTEIFGSDSLETRYQLHRQGDGCSVRLRIGAALRRLGRLPSVSRERSGATVYEFSAISFIASCNTFSVTPRRLSASARRRAVY